jgi:hypothetical protein
MVFTNLINFNIIKIRYYENISCSESKNASLILLNLIEFIKIIDKNRYD